MIENDDVEINSITDIRNIFDLIVASEILEKIYQMEICLEKFYWCI